MEKNINQIIKERRSIYPKEFNGKIIPEEVIETLLENANYAPNHLSNYPWRFIVISGNALQHWLEKSASIYESETPAEKFKPEKAEKTRAYKNQVSHAIAIVSHRESGSKSIAVEDMCAVAAAVENMYLSLSQFETVAGYWSTGLGTYSANMHAYLGLDEEDTLMGFFVLGMVDVKRLEGRRKDYKNFVRYL